jgi:hypothetical protein
MAKYLFVYHGGGMPEGAAAQKKAMDDWGKWMGGMGSALVDGGHPVGKSSTVMSDGRVVSDGGANPASGYSIVEAATLQEALAHAKGCPIRAVGGSIEVAEAFDM